MKSLIAVAAAVVLFSTAGCGRKGIVSVSGVVKLNDKPYPNAVVSFQPIGDKDNPNPGRGSAAVTDENGKFTLVYDGEKPGALVGKHRVRIFTKQDVKPPPDDKSESARGEIIPFERIPAEWNEYSEKEFEVPPGGTDQANFDIWTAAAKKKK